MSVLLMKNDIDSPLTASILEMQSNTDFYLYNPKNLIVGL